MDVSCNWNSIEAERYYDVLHVNLVRVESNTKSRQMTAARPLLHQKSYLSEVNEQGSASLTREAEYLQPYVYVHGRAQLTLDSLGRLFASKGQQTSWSSRGGHVTMRSRQVSRLADMDMYVPSYTVVLTDGNICR